MPKADRNERSKVVYTIEGDCIHADPHTLKFAKRKEREILVQGDPQNSGDVVLEYEEQAARVLFDVRPGELSGSLRRIRLKPGSSEKFVLKSNLGIEARDDFGPKSPKFSREFRLTFNRCDHGDHDDFHIEC
jgi:hypothetical protein